MKKQLYFFGLLIIPFFIQAQNVGIGTTTPLAKLQINHQGNTTVGLQLLDSGALRLGSIKFSSINNPVGMYISGNYQSSFNKDHYLHISSDTALITTFRGDGTVGIGTTTPTEKLEIKNPLRSTVKVSSNSTLDTTELQLSNKTVNGFGTFYTDFSIKSIREEGLFFSSRSDFPTYNSSNSLVILPQGNVGIGNSLPAYKLDVNGDINTNGRIRLNGNAGTAGQVLTSSGAADPTWANAAYANDTRFAYGISQFSPATAATSTGGEFTFGTAKYNLNPASVSVSGTTLTIAKTGLYHFELFYDVQFYYASAATSVSPLHSNTIIINYPGSFNPQLAYRQEIRRESTTSNTWNYNGSTSVDVYIQAPRTISINSIFTRLAGATNSVIQDGLFYGHLISE